MSDVQMILEIEDYESTFAGMFNRVDELMDDVLRVLISYEVIGTLTNPMGNTTTTESVVIEDFARKQEVIDNLAVECLTGREDLIHQWRLYRANNPPYDGYVPNF